MKLTIRIESHFGKRCVVARAVIFRSKKQGITRQYQKSWRLITVAPEFTLKEQTPALEAEAKRWEQAILNPVIRKFPVQEGLL